jgi:hypothetical protein
MIEHYLVNTKIKWTRGGLLNYGIEKCYTPYFVAWDCDFIFCENYVEKIIEMFNSEKLTLESMFSVVDNWKYSCEHNLTNNSMNGIAYIGQGACCIYCGAPSTITMECWSKLTKEVQERANKNALQAIERWKENNKFIQLCLNID